MPSNDTQKPLQAFPSSFDDLVLESVGEYLAREGWDIDASGFAFEYITEGGVAPAEEGVEGGDVCLVVITPQRTSASEVEASCQGFFPGCFSGSGVQLGNAVG